MLALTIIALILGLASVAVGVILIFRVSALYADMENLAKWQGDLDNEVKGVKLAVDDLSKEDSVITYPNLDGVSYDPKTSTMTVKGNLRADGWIASGGIAKED